MTASQRRALTVSTHDYHTGGEPFRIVSGGVGPIGGDSVLASRAWIAANLDHVRQLLVNEPRGHADMYGGFVVAPNDEGADLGVVFFHNEGYSTACGHGTIALATWAVEHGVVGPPTTGEPDVVDVVIDVPSGRLPTRVRRGADGLVEEVSFTNVPSYVASQAVLQVEGVEGEVVVDIAFGGAFYAILPAASVGLTVAPADLAEAIAVCRAIKDTLNEVGTFVHPEVPDLRDIYGVILVEEVPERSGGGSRALSQRNVTVFADGEVDRSATGSGTSARLALLHHQGRLAVGQTLHNHSIIDTVMRGTVSGETRVGEDPAVVTEVAGQAFPTGVHTFTLRPDDPVSTGFLLR